MGVVTSHENASEDPSHKFLNIGSITVTMYGPPSFAKSNSWKQYQEEALSIIRYAHTPKTTLTPKVK